MIFLLLLIQFILFYLLTIFHGRATPDCNGDSVRAEQSSLLISFLVVLLFQQRRLLPLLASIINKTLSEKMVLDCWFPKDNEMDAVQDIDGSDVQKMSNKAPSFLRVLVSKANVRAHLSL